MSRNHVQGIFGRTIPLWLRVLVSSAAYFVCAAAGGYLSAPGTTYVSFWLPAGLYVAVLLLNPRSDWPWLVLGAFAANLFFDYLHGTKPITMVFFFFGANTLQAMLGAWLLQQFVAPRFTLATLKEFAGLLGFAGLGSTMLGALVGATTLVHFDINPSLEKSWEVWWASCAMPVLVLTPFIVVWFSRGGARRAASIPARRLPEAVLLLGVLIFAVCYVMMKKGGIMSPYKNWLIPILLYSGIRFGVHGATVATLVLSLLAAYLNAQYSTGLTPQQLASGEGVFVLQGALATGSLVGIVPAIVLGERDQTLARLRESEARFRQLTEASFEGIAISEDGRVLDANDQLLKMLGYSRDEMIGKRIVEMIAPETRDIVAEAIRTGHESDYEHRVLRKDGSSFIAEARVKLIEAGQRKLRMTALRDITERNRAGQALRRSEELFRAIVEDQTEMIVRWKPDGTRTFINAAYCRVFGGMREELVGASFLPLLSAELREALLARIRALTPQNPVSTAIDRSLAPGGNLRWQEWTDRALFDERGQMVELQSTGRDITARKRAEDLADTQRQVLEMIATGRTLPETLDTLLRCIEAQSHEMLCSILLLDPDGIHVRHGAAPSLPTDYLKAIDGSAIGPCAGSCGTAAFRREAVFVADIASDPLWVDYRHLALPHGLYACWSTPILDAQRNVLGTFAIYYRTPGLPNEWHLRLISVATHIAAVCITKHRTESERAEAVVREQSARAHYTLQLIASQEAERGRIAVELHDSLGQNLSIIKNRAHLASRESSIAQPVAEHLQAIERIAADAIAETRNLAHNLRPMHIEQVGLTGSLQELIREVSQSCQTHFERRLENVDDIFKGEAATNLYRVVQEALNNLVKYSGAHEARITLERDVRTVRLRIADDGAGFDMNAAAGRSSFGLTSMNERVRMLGGTLRIESAPGKGTELIVELPFTDGGES